MNVGFVGVGRMGFPMASNLLTAGFSLTVWNRTVDRCASLAEAGARVADDPASLGRASEIVVTMVTDAEAAHSVLVEGGLLDALKPGSIVVEMSTIGPHAVGELAAEAERRGLYLLDAPVSGSVVVARAAELFAMVGGEARAYERATPVLDAMTKEHILLGPSGAGAAMKLAINAAIAVSNESVAETLALAESWGIDRERAYDVLAGGVLASPFVLYKREAFLRPDSEPVAFTTALMGKDLVLALGLAAELGVRMPAASAAAAVLLDVQQVALADADIARVIDVLR